MGQQISATSCIHWHCSVLQGDLPFQWGNSLATSCIHWHSSVLQGGRRPIPMGQQILATSWYTGTLQSCRGSHSNGTTQIAATSCIHSYSSRNLMQHHETVIMYLKWGKVTNESKREHPNQYESMVTYGQSPLQSICEARTGEVGFLCQTGLIQLIQEEWKSMKSWARISCPQQTPWKVLSAHMYNRGHHQLKASQEWQLCPQHFTKCLTIWAMRYTMIQLFSPISQQWMSQPLHIQAASLSTRSRLLKSQSLQLINSVCSPEHIKFPKVHRAQHPVAVI